MTEIANSIIVARELLTTNEASEILSLRPQSMRAWSSKGGPLTPVKIGNRLRWRMADIRKLIDGNNQPG